MKLNWLDKILNPRLMQRINENLCHICDNKLNITKDKYTFDGFYDQDTGVFCHFSCKKKHYEDKEMTEFSGQFSEVPVTIRSFESLVN